MAGLFSTVLTVAAAFAADVSGAPPKPLLQAKLTGATGSGNAVISPGPNGQPPGLNVQVKGLTTQAKKVVGVVFVIGGKTMPVGQINLDANGNGGMMTNMFPKVNPGDVCAIMLDTQATALQGVFMKP